jgi:3-deoxy-manno-octulosonate cytidylyltransferase (CMP-KDO synthetase)
MVAADTGRPLVQHVVDRVKLCRRVRDVMVATDDERIASALRTFGTHVVMTDVNHQSGTDRVAEVAANLSDDVIVNVQGDEPEIEPEVVDGLVERMESSADDMATAAVPFPAGGNASDPNLVKVVVGLDGRAIYFSRSPVPYRRDPDFSGNAGYNLHLGIYAYRRDFLLTFARWTPTPLELTEKLEQLRALEHGRTIHVRMVARATHGIDTPGQYAAFLERYRRSSES